MCTSCYKHLNYLSKHGWMDGLVALVYTLIPWKLFAYHAGLPNELVEDSKFVPINVEDPRYGPPVSHG